MAITINGSGIITGISAGGLPDGSVTSDDIASAAVTDAKLASNLDLSGKTITLPAGVGGKVLQVVSTTKTDTFSTSSNGTFDITGLSASITPSSTSSKILIMAKVNVSNSNPQNTSFTLQLKRGSTLINAGDSAGSRIRGFSGSEEGISDNPYGTYQTYDYSTQYLDSPSTTSAITYKISVVLSQMNVFVVNRTASDGDTAAFPRNTSNIVLMEIGV
jgi:hypothetical protein